LVKESWRAPAHYAFGTETLVPFRAGDALAWRLAA
jgi:dihydroorotase